MRIASDIARVFPSQVSTSIFLCGGSGRLPCRLDTVCDQLDLVLSVADGPIPPSSANNVDQFEEGALVPALSDLDNLSVSVEADDMKLQFVNHGLNSQKSRLLTTGRVTM